METTPSETELAIRSILQDKVTEELELENERKRKLDELIDDGRDGKESPTQGLISPVRKKQFIERLYNDSNKGPYEIVVQNKDKSKLNPFRIGKIWMTHHTDIVQINRSSKNITVICKTHIAANDLVQSENLTQFNVFVPSNRVHCVGVVYVEPEITEKEISEVTLSPVPIINVQRIKRRVNHELTNTHFVKITFETDKLPEYVSLNYVRMAVEHYIFPIKQCFICYSYGHVASSLVITKEYVASAARNSMEILNVTNL